MSSAAVGLPDGSGTVPESAAAFGDAFPHGQRATRVRRGRLATATADAVVIVCVVVAATWIQFGRTPAASVAALATTVTAVTMATTWVLALALLRRRAHRWGVGGRFEAVPLALSAATALAGVAVLHTVTGWPNMPALVVVAAPAGLAALFGIRAVRVAAAHGRTRSALTARTLVIGPRTSVEQTLRSVREDAHLLLQVVGVALDEPTAELTVDATRYAVLGTIDDVAAVAARLEIDTVVISGGFDDPERLRRLIWSLEGVVPDLALVNRLTDVDRSRIAFDRADSLALTHVRLPSFDGSYRREKRALDVTVSLLALIPIALLTPLIALLIVADSRGGVLFRQKRVGRDGREFEMLKFRTMSAAAEDELPSLQGRNDAAGPLFKLRADPRVTRVGATLRKFSLDELPQFWNVLRGEMSVVGPRPPLPSEVRAYDGDVMRRLHVQPGITGLWQVSGRSDLSWEQSVRLDLRYVDNWSMATDLKIIARTASVMIHPRGAY